MTLKQPVSSTPASPSPPPAADGRFERWRKLTGVALAPAAFAATWLLTAGHLTDQGRPLAAVLAAVGVLWVTEPLPLPITAILGAVMCIVLGVADAKTVLAPFADPIIFLFIGSFILAQAMMLHRLDRRIALAMLSLPWIGASPIAVMGALGLVTAGLSMWISNTATAAMMLPIALGILEELRRLNGIGDLRRWPFAAGVMLMIAYAASIGGIGTPVGSPPNLIAVGLIRSLTGVEISFFRWMALAVPMVAVMGLGLFLLLWFLHPVGPVSRAASTDLSASLRRTRRELGRWTLGQANTLAAFLLAVALWVLPGVLGLMLPEGHGVLKFFQTRVTEAVVALGVACLLFILPVDLRRGRFTIAWDEAVKIDWGTIFLFGGGLSLGTLMFQTGVAETFGHGIAELTGATSLWTLTAVAVAMGIVISEATSNTAAATMVIPLAIALAQGAGVTPVPPALGACFGASYGFMLPVATPPNAIVYGSGLVSIGSMVRAGTLFDLLGFALIITALRVLCPLLGL
jgi:sodium-dependent dicarboxylate transporter 2/3/5